MLINAWAENNYLLPDNKDKHFISAKDFIKHYKLKRYTPFNEANINFQHKLLYKELNQFIKSNVNEYYYKKLINIYSNRNDTVSPNRQVYFYCSILETDNTFKYKYVIFDSETTDRIAEGGGIFKAKEYIGEIKQKDDESREHWFFRKTELPSNLNSGQKPFIDDWAEGNRTPIIK